MSTKIYEAWIIRSHYLHNFLQVFRDTTLTFRAEQLRRISAVVTDSEIGDEVGLHRKQRDWDESELIRLKERLRLQAAVRLCQQCSLGPYREPVLDLDVGVRICVPPGRTGWIGIIPYGEHRPWGAIAGTKNELEWRKWYPYWDNVDPPSDVTEEQWRVRRVFWEKITDLYDEWHTYSAFHTVLDMVQGIGCSKLLQQVWGPGCWPCTLTPRQLYELPPVKDTELYTRAWTNVNLDDLQSSEDTDA